MTHTHELKSLSLQQPLRQAAWRRNLRTAAIVAIALSGGLFGLIWFTTSSTIGVLALMLLRLKQQQILP